MGSRPISRNNSDHDLRKSHKNAVDFYTNLSSYNNQTLSLVAPSDETRNTFSRKNGSHPDYEINQFNQIPPRIEAVDNSFYSSNDFFHENILLKITKNALENIENGADLDVGKSSKRDKKIFEPIM